MNERDFKNLRQRFQVEEMPRLTDEVSLAALDWSDQIVLVTTPDLAAVARARQHLALLGDLGVGEERIHLVLNQARHGGLFCDNSLARAGLSPVAVLPSDPVLVASVEKGCPWTARSAEDEVAEAMAALCQALRGCRAEEEAPKPAPSDLVGRVRSFVEELRCRLASA